jgi:hypothetical protein
VLLTLLPCGSRHVVSGCRLDLLDPYNVRHLRKVFEAYQAKEKEAGRPLPENANHSKYLDCAVFQYAYAAIENTEEQLSVDSARAVYVPTGKKSRVWSRSWISNEAHVQICVRNPSCILGTWLHHPTHLEHPDGVRPNEVARNDLQPEDREGSQEIEDDADGGSHPVAR